MKNFLFSGIIACLIGFCFSCTTTEESAGLQMRAGLPNFNYKIHPKLSFVNNHKPMQKKNHAKKACVTEKLRLCCRISSNHTG